MKSIIQPEKDKCYLCGRNASADYFGLDEHHVFGGADRKTSEAYGLKVYLCHDHCHINGVHKKAKLNRALQRRVQEIAMKRYDWDMETWRALFGKNYL